VEDLARMEPERGEYLSVVCNNEAREGLSQCIDTVQRVPLGVRLSQVTSHEVVPVGTAGATPGAERR
jgi:hypothetical protein